jgi:transcriptional/translational regulatory protein YebC/TACO1
LMILALEAGAEDFTAEDEYYEILTAPNDFSKVCEELENAGLEFASAEITMLPTTYTELTDPETIEKMEKLLERLEDHDDVQNIWHNWSQD